MGFRTNAPRKLVNRTRMHRPAQARGQALLNCSFNAGNAPDIEIGRT